MTDTEDGKVLAITFAGTGIKARKQLYWRDPLCYWCGQETILFIPFTREQEIEGNHIAHNATMDHEPNGGEWLVNACAFCNHLRNELEYKMAAHKHLPWNRIASLRPLLERWLQVGRPQTVRLANYVLGQPFIELIGVKTRAEAKKRKQLLTIATWQMMVLAAVKAQEVLPLSAGEAGALVVHMYGRSLARLADS